MVNDDFVTSLAARVRELEATQAGLEQNQADMAARLAEATTVSAMIGRAGGDTGPMPGAFPRPRVGSHKRPNPAGLHIVRGHGVAAVLWLLHGAAAAFKGAWLVKACKIALTGGGAVAILVIASHPVAQLDEPGLVGRPDVSQVAPAVHHYQPAHLHRHHRPG